MEFICLEIDGSLDMFSVDERDIDHVREEAIVKDSDEKVIVLHLKDGRRCISISTMEREKEVESLKRLLR